MPKKTQRFESRDALNVSALNPAYIFQYCNKDEILRRFINKYQ